ncbi:peptide chain release factor 1 [Mycoplasma sp. (ex Biomphalaria glabrata)]|uniref:peptide chain release factor 1 n=1 Tax=Mycoplasma sp. (ex Biomphalaria glabrata) TaxID=1749074 RepID=UPI00073A5BDA|nr:peptide chain release factor 1 [Mycoplasma sp. (ex Biomphalaria glabrata)]ALV23607.1 peptide chain release factor 1 [Mycoplasma sp. (ex Biomphalaria glabrata)]
MNNALKNRLNTILQNYLHFQNDLQNESIISDFTKVKDINIKIKEIEEVALLFQKYLNIERNVAECKEILELGDEELSILAKEELKELPHKLEEIEEEIKISLLPKDLDDDKNVIVEIRGAAGGDEANIFASDLFDMYSKYAATQNWKIEVQEAYDSPAGGFSQISFLIKGKNVYKKLKYESGVHRVQRVPATENKGRVHTSTASVAVLPEATDVDVKINASDLRIDTYRASGAGGQHINVTDSAVRITHMPTGVVVSSQDGRSQHDNKEKAMRMLRSKIYETKKAEEAKKIHDIRTLAVGSGMRAEKIRTYNYPQNRLTDHRINLTLNKLDIVMEGNLDEIITSLMAFDQREMLEKSGI